MLKICQLLKIRVMNGLGLFYPYLYTHYCQEASSVKIRALILGVMGLVLVCDSLAVP